MVWPYALVDQNICSTWDSQRGIWSPQGKRWTLLEDFPWWVKVSCLLHSKLKKEPHSRCYTYAGKYSKAACIDVGILPLGFPKPMTSPPSVTCNAIHLDSQHYKIDPPANKHKFDYPKTPQYQPTSENIQKLKKWLLDQFAAMVFNNSRKFPSMSSPPAYIHLKEGSTPKPNITLFQYCTTVAYWPLTKPSIRDTLV